MKPTTSKKKTPQVSSTLGLAKQLGLSEWTVSRAINGHPEVKAATRDRILRAMEEFGFRPNPVARRLSGKGMGIVGVCFGMARNALMMEKITILDEFLRDNALRGVLAICPPDEANQIQILKDFKHLRVDGLVLVQPYPRPSELLKTLTGVPSVYVDSAAEELTPRIWLDRPKAMRMSMEHLWSLGHRSFGTLGFSDSNLLRWVGLAQFLGDRGIDAGSCVQSFELPSYGLESYAEGIRLAEMALTVRRLPTALLAINDAVAVGAIQCFRDRGINVPEDVSIMGFGNFEAGQYLRPALTTIDQRPQLMMRLAGEMLLAQIRHQPGDETLPNNRLEPLLIERDSTAHAPHTTKR